MFHKTFYSIIAFFSLFYFLKTSNIKILNPHDKEKGPHHPTPMYDCCQSMYTFEALHLTSKKKPMPSITHSFYMLGM